LPYATVVFQPDSSGFPPQAAISHAALARGKSNNKMIKGVLTSFEKA
jgi:hypothetical protein